MVDRVRFSHRELSLNDIAIHHLNVEAALFEFFAGSSQALLQRYADTKRGDARDRSLAELDFSSSLSVLSSTEAAIRIDYLRRVYGRWRDPLSRAMKSLYREKEEKARLEGELLRLWGDHAAIPTGLVSAMSGAFKYRHWLAHGRYWMPKFGRQYDYHTVYGIAQQFTEEMDHYNAAHSH